MRHIYSSEFPIFRITVIMTEQCNFGCKYCYVNNQKNVISEEVLLGTTKIVEEKILEGYNVNIDIFGGEPLLHKDKVKFFVKEIEKIDEKYPQKVKAIIFTNASLMDEEFANFAVQYRRFLHYNFSLDGNEECNNSSRVYLDGRGTYDDIIRGMRVVADVYHYDWRDVGGKFVISKFNYMHIMDTAKDYLKLGKKRISFSVARDNTWDEESIKNYEIELRALADFYIANINEGLWYDVFALPILDYEYRSKSYCSTGKEHLSVTPNGDIYPCQRFYNNRSGFKFGDVFNGIDTKNKWYKFFQNYTVPNNFIDCKKCELFNNFNCVGQCMASMYENGNIFRVIPEVCEVLKINYRVAKYVNEQLKGNPFYEKTLDRSNYGG